MKILFLTNNTRIDNGWGRTARELIEALRTHGIVVEVLVEEGSDLAGERLALRWALVHPLFVFLAAARVFFAALSSDLIHAFDGYPYTIIAALANTLLRKKLIVTLHGTYALAPFYGGPLSLLYRWALRRAHLVVGVSNFTVRAVSERAALPAHATIPNGTSSLWLTAPRSVVKPPVPRPYILSVGMVKPQKGFLASIEAFATVKKKHPNLSYAIVGNQRHNFFKELRRRIKELGIERAVFFFDNTTDTDLISLYDAAELFVLTPIRQGPFVEGFGLVYREAGARGLAVVGSRDCGAEDAVLDGKSGLLVRQGDIPGIAAAIERLLQDEELRRRMGNEGRIVSHAWTWDRVAEEYISKYKKLLQ